MSLLCLRRRHRQQHPKPRASISAPPPNTTIRTMAVVLSTLLLLLLGFCPLELVEAATGARVGFGTEGNPAKGMLSASVGAGAGSSVMAPFVAVARTRTSVDAVPHAYE